MASSTIEGLKPFTLLGGYDAAELWPTVNLVLPGWLLLAVAPRWKHTPTLALIGPILHAVIYTLSLLSILTIGNGGGESLDFSSLQGIVTMFKDPNVVFIGWIHYGVSDSLLGRWIVMDSIERECSTLVHTFMIVPCLFLAMMTSPFGWLLYVAVVRNFVLPGVGVGVGVGGAGAGASASAKSKGS